MLALTGKHFVLRLALDSPDFARTGTAREILKEMRHSEVAEDSESALLALGCVAEGPELKSLALPLLDLFPGPLFFEILESHWGEEKLQQIVHLNYSLFLMHEDRDVRARAFDLMGARNVTHSADKRKLSSHKG